MPSASMLLVIVFFVSRFHAQWWIFIFIVFDLLNVRNSSSSLTSGMEGDPNYESELHH